MANKIYKAAIDIILIFSSIILLFLTINSIVHYVYLDVEDGNLGLHFHDLLSIIMLAALLIIIFLFSKYILIKISDKTLFAALATVMTLAGIYLIVNCVPAVRADAMMVYNYIERFNAGNYVGIEDGYYFSWNPALLGLLTYERIIGAFTMNLRVFYAFELVWYLLIHFLIWMIARKITKDTMVVKLVVLISFMFFPVLFYILQVYGMLLGFALALSSLYMLILAMQSSGKKQYIYFVLSALFIGLACLIKQQYQIMMIAMIIICFLEFIRSKKPVLLMAAIIMPIVTICFSSILFEAYRKASGYDMGTGEPISLYIAMGLQDSENPLNNGTYNGYNYDTYSDLNFDEKLSSQIAKQDIKKRLNYFAKNPAKMCSFFYNKFTGTWNEPTFASIANGCSVMWGETPNDLLLGSLYDGDHLYHIYVKYMSALLFFLYLTALATIIIRTSRKYEWNVLDIFPYLYLTGGFLYHLMSESSARYVYIYVFMLIPALAGELPGILNKINKPKES
ncbi:MAG: hypothetical protein J5504_08245 [Butyrivibrio sp.]|nr:hypothetical protein [Butyrivibrio sp.]